MRLETETPTITVPATTCQELLTSAKAKLDASDQSFREALKIMLRLNDGEFGMTQRAIAEGVGRHESVVSRWLTWARGGFEGESPYGPTTKTGREELSHAKVSTEVASNATERNAWHTATVDAVKAANEAANEAAIKTANEAAKREATEAAEVQALAEKTEAALKITREAISKAFDDDDSEDNASETGPEDTASVTEPTEDEAEAEWRAKMATRPVVTQNELDELLKLLQRFVDPEEACATAERQQPDFEATSADFQLGDSRMQPRDSAQFRRPARGPMITDASGGTLGLHQPGYRVSSGGNIGDQWVRDGARADIQSIYDAYAVEQSEAWRTPTGFGSGKLECIADNRADAKTVRRPDARPATGTLDQRVAQHKKVMDAEYETARCELESAWRKD